MDAEYLIVRVSSRLCALPLSVVRETARTPRTLGNRGDIPALLGIATFRGTRTAVLDLKTLLGYVNGATEDAESGSRAVAVSIEGSCVLLAVDDVLGVRHLDDGQLTTMALPGGSERQMGRFDSEFARVIEAGGFVTEETWAALEQEAEGPA